METTHTWKTVSENEFTLWVNDQSLATLTLVPKSAKGDATVETPEGKWFIRREGFWKNRLMIEDENGNTWAEITPKAWYSSQWIIRWQGNEDQLVLHNNPLAEYAILRDGKPLLGYGLTAAEGKTGLKVTQQEPGLPILLHVLLWYLFVPIAKENIADSDTLLFLLMVG